MCVSSMIICQWFKVARKTLRCGLVRDVAQRTNGSEIVHMFWNNADLEVLCQMYVVGNTRSGT